MVRLRDELRCLRLCCEDLRLAAGEREGQYRTAEAALQHLVLDTDRRLTLQQQQHQGSMQQLLKQLRGTRKGGCVCKCVCVCVWVGGWGTH